MGDMRLTTFLHLWILKNGYWKIVLTSQQSFSLLSDLSENLMNSKRLSHAKTCCHRMLWNNL